MDRRTLSLTDLEVSRFGFGTMTLGKPLDQAGTNQVIDRCLDAGINFFDTANMYNAGVAETLLGTALKSKRDKVVLASKVFFKMGEEPDQHGLSRSAILRAIDESLHRTPDRLPRPLLPARARSHRACRRVARSYGNVGQAGQGAVSGIVKLRRMGSGADALGLSRARLACALYLSAYVQLLARGIEQEYLPMCKEFGISTVVYNPLAGGLLTGKHRPDVFIPGTRFDNNKMYQDRYWHEQQFHAVERFGRSRNRQGAHLSAWRSIGCCTIRRRT